MPNWCYNNIAFSGPKLAIKKLFDFINEQQSIPNTVPEYHIHTNMWLGTFLRRANLDFDKFECRGSIISWPDVMSIHKDSATFTIETNSVWRPMIKMWQAIAQTFSDEISIIYTSEEPGLGDYYTNDSSMIGKYIVNTYGIEKHKSLKDTIFYEEAEETYSEGDLKTNLLKVYHEDCHKDLSTDQLISLICKDYKGICINQFKFCSIDDVG